MTNNDSTPNIEKPLEDESQSITSVEATSGGTVFIINATHVTVNTSESTTR